MHNLKTVLAAECSDQDIDGLADRDALRSQESVVCRGLLGDAEPDHVKLRQRQQKRKHLISLAPRANALNYFAVYEISNGHKIPPQHWSTLATARLRVPLRYSIQADVSTMTISVSSHFVQVALPTDFALELAELLLAVDLNQQPQTGLYCRPLCSAAAETQRPRHQLVIYHNIRSHNTPRPYVLIVHIGPVLVNPIALPSRFGSIVEGLLGRSVFFIRVQS